MTDREIARPHAPVLDVIVVGAGFSGIGAAIKLQEAGIEFIVLEKSSEIGGVWRDNRYPDCACDIPSPLYSYSFAPNPHWSHLFAKQAQIKAYCAETARKFGVIGRVRLQHELLEAVWSKAEQIWVLQTNAGTFRARFVVMASGPMHVPTVPQIPGLHSFSGTYFHSSRWDPQFDLSNQRVAVVGSGASAIQFLPLIAPQVKELTLFQRTAPWVLPKSDFAISPAWQQRFQNHPWLQGLLRGVLYLQFEALNTSLKFPWLIKRLQRIGLRNIHRGVQDPDLRKQLTPNFALGCKRILQSNTWYRALSRPNVRVVSGIREIQGRLLVATDGKRCEVDAIIFATGFEVSVPPIAQRIIGASGKPLAEQWNGSPQAYLGTMFEDCPNLFLTLGPNLYTFASAFTIIETQVKFIVSAIKTAHSRQIVSIRVNPEKSRRYNQALQSALARTVWNSGCSSYFLDHNGRNSTNWPWTTFWMRAQLRRFRVGDFLTDR